MAVNRSFEQFLIDAEERYGAKPSYQNPVSTGTSSRVGEWGGNAYQQFLEDLEKIRSGKMTVKNSKRVGPKTDADNPYAPKVRFNEPNQVKYSERQRLDAILSMNQDDDQPKQAKSGKQTKSGVKQYRSEGAVGTRKGEKKLGAEAAARRTAPKRVEPYQYDPEKMSGVGGKFQTEDYYTEAYGKPIKDRMDEIEQKIVDWNQGVYTPTGTVDALMREYDELNTRYAQWKADMYSEEQKKALSALTPEELKTLDEYILLRNAPLTLGLNPGERRERKRREDELQRELIQKYGSELWMLVEYRGRQVNEILTRQNQEALTEAVTKDGLAGFGAAALSVLQTYTAGPMAAAETAGQRVTRALGLTSKYAPIDTNAPGFQIQNEKSTIREIQRKQITGDNPTEGQELLGFVYDGIMSSLDSAAAAAAPGEGGISALLLASSAGTDAVQRYTERGATAHQAVLIGIIAAVNEWMFEKISIGEFKRMQEVPLDSWKSFLHNILITGGAVNASEETLTELANVQSDMWLPSNISEWASRVQELTEYFMSENGRSREEAEQLAKKTAAGEFGKQIGLAGAGGLFQGVLMGGIGSLGSVVINGIDRYTPETLRQNQERWNAEMRQQNATIREGAFNAARLQAQQDGAAYQAENGMEQTQPEITTGAELFREEQEAAQAAAEARAEDIAEEVRAEVKTPAEAAEQIRERAVELREEDPLAAAALDNIAQQADNEIRAGVTPASEMTQEGNYGTETAGAGDNVSDGSGQWNAGRSAGEQAGGVDGAAGGNPARSRSGSQAAQAISRQNHVRDLRIKKVSPKQAGIRGGTDDATMTVMPRDTWDNEMTSNADRIKAETGLDVVYFLGQARVNKGRKSFTVDGTIQGNKIYIKADNLKYSVTQLTDHELYHNKVRQDPGLVRTLRDQIVADHREEEFHRIAEAYASALDGVYETEDDINRIYEEIFADAYAGMNKFGQEAGKEQTYVRGMTAEREQGGRFVGNAADVTDLDSGTAEDAEAESQIAGEDEGPTDDWAFEEMEEDEDRYSVSDEEYLALAEDPEANEAQLQAMVDQAAEAAMPESKVRDEDGNLLRVYHGTDEQFTVFDPTKGRSTMDIQGSFFSPWEIDAGGYGENVRAFYLNIRNPAPEGTAYRTLNRFKGQNNAGVKAREYLERLGYDGVNNGDEEYIAFYPEQIKSADPVTYDDDGSVIPLSQRFNPENDDIRYSTSDTELQEDEYIPQRAPGVEKLMRGVIAGLNRQFEIHRKAYQPQARRLMMDFLDRCLETGEINSGELDEVVRQLWNMGGRWNVEEEGGFDEVRRFLRRGVTLYVPTEVQHEFSDDWKNARIQLVGLGIRPTGRTSEMGIDQYWQTLTEQFPGFFSEEETDRAEMLRQILDVARRGRRVWQDNDEIDREAVEQMGADPDERYDALRETVYDLASDFMDVAKPIHDQWAAKPHKPQKSRRKPREAEVLEPAGAELFEEEEEPAPAEPVQEAGPDFSYGDYMEQQEDADRAPEITTGAELFDSDEPPYGNQWDDRGERWDGTLRTIGRDDIMDFDPDMTRADFHRQNGELTPEVPGERTEEQILREESSRAADEALRDYLSREEFRATDHLDRLGVKIDGSVPVNYGMAQGLLYADRANKALLKDIRKAERRLGVTAAEKEFAHGIVAGLYTEEDIPRAMRADKVMELAQYYMDERALGEDMIRQQRVEINRQLDQRMKDLFKNVDEIVKRVPSLLRINYNTPQRNMRAIFGDDLGEQINREVFDPVARNEAERLRWINQQFDKVRRFRDSRGRQSSLNRQESGLVQMVIEGRAVAEQVASMEMEGAIRAAAEDIRRGGDPAESAREQNLTADERRIAEKYARWMEAQELLQSDKVDSVKVENAVKAYQELFNAYYDAINDFLVVHGYEPIGFIKGYAPHMQSEESVNALSKALQAFGIKADVTELDTGLAGRTKDFRPNKRWNPYFLSRMGDETSYDIQKAFESYVDYLSDILYHTDDIMKLRRMSRFFRQTYSREEIRNTIEWAMGLQDAAAEQKAEFLRDQGVIGSGSVLSDNDIAKAMDDYTEKLFDQITKTTKFGNMVMWLDNYTNLLAGKQNSFDRAMEEFLGRRALNMGSKLTRWFARSNVGGNLSSMLNQTSQIPMILAENGNRNVMQALFDILSGKVAKAGFAQESDFLTGKRDIKYLENTGWEKFTNGVFKPAELMDRLVSTIAVRAAYRRGLHQGMSHEEALRFADRYGAEVMGTRMKGQKPVSFDNRNPLIQAVNMFQIEALNSWNHIGQDLPREIRRIASTHGRRKAAAALAKILLESLVAAFFLNWISEEVYGGTPAPLDFIGLTADFFSSGQGLARTEGIRRFINRCTEQAFGEKLFEESDAERQSFNGWDAVKDLGFNVSNEVPFFRNVSGMLGWGDETLPVPNVYGGIQDIMDASEKAGFLSGETAEAAGLLAAQVLPLGRQLAKTYQGGRTMLEGARMKGYGENERLLYPVEESAWNWIQGIMFGNGAFHETQEYYASGDRGLNKDQTSNYNAMVENGATRQDALDLILGKQDETPREQYRTILDSNVSDAEKLRQVEKVMSGRWPGAWDKLQNLMDQGVDLYEWYDVYTFKQEQENTGKGQKDRVMDYIDGLSLTNDQKDALYLYCGYSKNEIDEAPWH